MSHHSPTLMDLFPASSKKERLISGSVSSEMTLVPSTSILSSSRMSRIERSREYKIACFPRPRAQAVGDPEISIKEPEQKNGLFLGRQWGVSVRRMDESWNQASWQAELCIWESEAHLDGRWRHQTLWSWARRNIDTNEPRRHLINLVSLFHNTFAKKSVKQKKTFLSFSAFLDDQFFPLTNPKSHSKPIPFCQA